MGLNAASFYNNSNFYGIDQQALAKVKEQIFNPNNKVIDVSKLDLSKFNRVSLGTDLYSERTNFNIALQASKSVSDFGVNFSPEFKSNIQYLNSQAAQSLFNIKENTQAAFSIDISNQTIKESESIKTTSQTLESQNLNKDRNGSNPFAFYLPTTNNQDSDNESTDISAINIFA